MLRHVVAALCALAVLAPHATAAPPPDAFCVILIEALDGMQGVRVLVDEETTPEERAALFPAVDKDGDGAVTRPEGDAWRRLNLRLHNGTEGLPAVQRIWLRPADADGDGAPLYVAATRQVGHTFHKQDHRQPWPVTQSIDLETQAFREFSYPLVEGAAVFELLGGDDGAPRTSTTSTTTSFGASPTPEYVVVRAPEGWLVGRVQGRDYAGSIDVRPNAREVDLPAFDTKSPFTITFLLAGSSSTATDTQSHTVTPTTGAPTPSGGPDDTLDIAGPGFVALALACLALAVRRRL